MKAHHITMGAGERTPPPTPTKCTPLGTPSPVTRMKTPPSSKSHPLFFASPNNVGGQSRSSAMSPKVVQMDAPTSSGLDDLAAWISSNYMGMGKSAADALPELRRKGISAGVSNFSMGGQILSAPEIAQALRLQVRPGSRPTSPPTTSPPRTRSSSSSRSVPFFGSSPPSAVNAKPPSPPPPPATSPQGFGSGLQAQAAGLKWLAAMIASNYTGMGKSAADVLPELRRRGVLCSSVKHGQHLFKITGQGSQMDAGQVAEALRLQVRPGSSGSSPASSAPSAFPRTPPPPTPPNSPQFDMQARPASSSPLLASGLEELAHFISTNFMGMGKSAADALPELRRKGLTDAGRGLYTLSGKTLDALEVAQALRLQARTPSRPSTPTRASSPVFPSAPTSFTAPAAASGSASGLEGLAAWISTNYMGMGKSAADALPELRRKGISASGDKFSMGGQILDAAGIAQALRLQARTPSRPIVLMPSQQTPSAPASYSAAPAPASPSGSASGLEGLAAWISTNYMGMGKSAADVMPELRRKGIAASGSNFSMGGQILDAGGIAQALRLQARTSSRPSTPQPSRPASSSAPAPAAGSAFGLEGLAAWISTNYMGMGKSAADVMPELRRKGIAASGSSFSMGGQILDATGIAQALRLQARTPSRSVSPARPTQPEHAAPAPPATPTGSAASLEGLAAYISTNYMGMGKSVTDVMPELRRKGITASGRNFSMSGQILDAAGIAQALRLQARTPSRPSTPTRSSRPALPSAPSSFTPPSAPTGSTAGLEDLAAFIASNYMGMGKSAADALPELRRKGIMSVGGGNFSIAGRAMDAAGIAQALRLQVRSKGRPTFTPCASFPFSAPPPPNPAPSSLPSTSPTRPLIPRSPSSWDWATKQMTPEKAMMGTRWLAAWITSNYIGLGKNEADALPELRRRGVVCSSVRDGEHFFEVPRTQGLSAVQVASLLRLRAR